MTFLKNDHRYQCYAPWGWGHQPQEAENKRPSTSKEADSSMDTGTQQQVKSGNQVGVGNAENISLAANATETEPSPTSVGQNTPEQTISVSR